MNERIKDLAEQAGLEMYTSQATKFVELLIQESIEVMVEHDYHGEWLGEKLKEHFGTELRREYVF